MNKNGISDSYVHTHIYDTWRHLRVRRLIRSRLRPRWLSSRWPQRQKFTRRSVGAFYSDTANAEVPAAEEINSGRHRVRSPPCQRSSSGWWSSGSLLRFNLIRFHYVRMNRVGASCQSATWLIPIYLFIYFLLFFVHFLSTTNAAESAEPQPKLNPAACDKQLDCLKSCYRKSTRAFPYLSW